MLFCNLTETHQSEQKPNNCQDREQDKIIYPWTHLTPVLLLKLNKHKMQKLSGNFITAQTKGTKLININVCQT